MSARPKSNSRTDLLLRNEHVKDLADVVDSEYGLVDDLVAALQLTRPEQGKLRRALAEWQRQQAPVSERIREGLEGFASQVGRLHRAATGAGKAVQAATSDAAAAARAVMGPGAEGGSEEGVAGGAVGESDSAAQG